jgi:hypothetical protein
MHEFHVRLVAILGPAILVLGDDARVDGIQMELNTISAEAAA